MINNNKEKIIESLAEKEKSTSELCSIINRDWYYCIKILEELESKGKIERIELGKFTFWRLKNG